MTLEGTLKIHCISDLHGFYPKLQGGDLLIIAGDLTRSDKLNQYIDLSEWLYTQDYRKIVIVAGNHDGEIMKKRIAWPLDGKISYLEDSGVEFEGLKIWGSPWTLWFRGMNPHCAAFTRHTDIELEEFYRKIPLDTDILVTHNPPYDILDGTSDGINAGSPSLRRRINEIEPALHVFGHIHEASGWIAKGNTTFINASIVDENYKHVHTPTTYEKRTWSISPPELLHK